MKQMNIGMYYPASTYIHKIDARVKVIATVMVIALLFFSSNFLSYALISCFLLGLSLSARFSFKLFAGISSLRFVLILTFLFSVFLTPGETILLEWHWVYATAEGVHAGFVLVVRVILMLLTTAILTLTTTPFSLTSALEFLLSPLQKIRLPIAEGALMINLALRFVPTIIEEKDRIINSQKARGTSFEADGILKKAKSIVPVLIPLIISSFKRADDLALAMESRCFKIGTRRTSFHEMKMTKKDYITLIVIFLVFVGIIGLEYLMSA